ncbi:MAG: APC family permease [Ktedonobacteraceae bacterium]
MAIEPTVSSEKHTTLRPNSVGLPEVLFQSVTTMAPASAVSFSLVAALPYAGASLPLAVFIALIVCGFIAFNIGELAKHLPSAGGYFTYVSRSLGAQAGWMVGWLFDLAYLMIVPLTLLVLGPTMDSFMTSTFHISFGANGWVVWALIFAAIVFGLTYIGIKISSDVGVILGLIEICVFVILSIWLIVTAGSNNTAAVFTPAFSQQPGLGGWQGILFGMTFVFLAFSGFESAVPLAEETQNPRRTVPRAVLLATVIIGIFYVFCSYAGIVSWGITKMASYAADPNPWGTLATRAWGPFNVIVILVILNSALANANGGVNAAARVLYAMGRIGTLPTALAHTNRFRVPDVAIIVTMVVAVIATLLPGLLYGTTSAFAFIGTIITIPIILVYIATCIAVPFFYRREHREEFSVLRHIILPVIPVIVLLAVIYSQVVPLLIPPYPAAPISYAVPIVAVWFVVGVIIVAILNARAPQALAKSSKIYTETEEF